MVVVVVMIMIMIIKQLPFCFLAYHHISKTIELTRVHLFDIITQYRAIFSDDEIMNLSNKDERSCESLLFHGWIIQKVLKSTSNNSF